MVIVANLQKLQEEKQMALTDDGNMIMPVGPVGGGGFGGGFGNDWGWIILLLLFAGGGWGNGFGGGMDMYPWLNQSNQVNDGFRDQMLNTSVNGIQNAITSGFGDVQTALCGGFAGVNATVNAAQNGITSQMYNDTIANLERSFATQTANTAGLTNLSQQLSQCCCDNRLATCQTQNIVQSESAATRFADANNTRDIVDATNRNSQLILDKLCALELDGYKRENDNLRSQLNMATLRESQTAQNAFIAQGFADEVDQLYNRLNNCPVPSTPVYGRTPIFTCNNGGCNCGNF